MRRKRKRTRTPKKRGQLKSDLEVGLFKEIKKYAKSSGAMVAYETDSLPYTIRRNYIPDFVVHLPNGAVRYIEAKGYLRPEDRTKMRAVKEANPLLDIRFVFAKDNLVTGSKMRYSDWAIKYGFPYSIGSVPKDWLT